MTNGYLGQCIRLVEHQYGFTAKVGDFRQPARQSFQLIPARHAFERTGERLAATADGHGCHQPLDKAGTIVMTVQRQPGDHRPPRKELPAPLGQQKRLAESGRGMDRNRHLVRKLWAANAESLTHLCSFRASRWGGLED
ncbi:hypothetical protein D3C76_552180 [compost metagenome]